MESCSDTTGTDHFKYLISKLRNQLRKVGVVSFHPTADNILASVSADSTKIWDLVNGKDVLTLKSPDMVQSLSFNREGSMLVQTSRDKMIRIWDPRQQRVALECQGHGGAKTSRAVWLGNLDRIATTGFSKMSDRQLGLWDMKNLKEPIGDFNSLDQSAGSIIPFWDDDTKMLYLVGKGFDLYINWSL